MTTRTVQLHVKSFDVPDEAFPVGDLARVEIVQLGETSVHRPTFQPSFRWTEHVKPLMGTDLCEIPHRRSPITCSTARQTPGRKRRVHDQEV